MSISWWDRLLWQLGFAICHQEPDRLLRFGDRSLFVCSRDTGLFVSFFTVLLFTSFLRGRKRGGWPPWPLTLFAIAGIFFLAWDGSTSYLGYRESSNLMRFFSGLTAGGGLALLVAPWFNRTLFGADRRLKAASRPADLLAVLLAGGLPAALFLTRPRPLFIFAQAWLAISILGTFWSLNLLLVSLLSEKRSPGFSLHKAFAACLLTVLELGGSYALHRALLNRGPAPL
ncbi:MAG: hypothetical protein A2V52_03410 [Actinobacteria bacterium RBG_19FT_COMBO_54_7]|uniref:DUF2085 domain-containing protein n=1 Tax=Candidatus Solincola sediminis TaxID=1797199 RepID=A0A1F2WEX7_9ACTN|nr:MAG: hypothetical protein A2Y75_09835 [Candidatus Solincola sediminis]OFW59132.1 MAG: hypothetical protein A2W01_06645 [Candidatus Solincola sediminis]OFW65767.1 MAG: hypothetical protein A2V52_03410 [Actinobacteria bacterium RBG_19FT_COMBO_54_7]